MIKTVTRKTIEEFDDNGKLVRRTITETEETDDSNKQYIPLDDDWKSPWEIAPWNRTYYNTCTNTDNGETSESNVSNN